MDKPIFRMSESGKCARALSAQLLDYEPEAKPEWLERTAREGSKHEDWIVEELESEGYFVLDRQKEIILEFPSFSLLGHIDGSVVEDGKWSAYASQEPMPSPKLLEIKTMSDFEFQRWMRGNFKEFPQYASQITCYMEATGLKECLYIVKNRNNGYEDRRILTEKPCELPDIKLGLVVNYINNKMLAPADFDPQSLECRRCEYRHLCLPEPRELTPVEQAGLNSAADKWRRGKQLVSEGQVLIDQAKEVFEDHTIATGIYKWQHQGLAIQLVHYRETKTYPKSKLLSIFTELELEPASEVKGAYDSLRITDMEASND